MTKQDKVCNVGWKVVKSEGRYGSGSEGVERGGGQDRISRPSVLDINPGAYQN